MRRRHSIGGVGRVGAVALAVFAMMWLAVAMIGGGKSADAQPSLDVQLEVVASSRGPGDQVQVRMTIVNSNTVPLLGASMVSPLPDLSSYVPGSVSATAPTAQFDSAGSEIRWQGDVPAGGSVSVQFLYEIDDDAPCFGRLLHVMEAEAPGEVSGADEVDVFVLCADALELTIAKTVDVAEANDGDVLGYTITVENPNGQPVTATLTDILPQNTTFVGGSLTSTLVGVEYNDLLGRVTFTGPFPPNSTTVVSYDVRIDIQLAPCPAIENDVTIATQHYLRTTNPVLTEVTCLPKLCGGQPVTIIWEPGASATDGDDVILGTAADDFISALDGDDIVCSAGGDDQVEAGDGNDLVFAARGDDVVQGGPGDDRLHGRQGDDTLVGGPGNDTLHGNFGDDQLSGEDGNDRLFGYGNNDRLFGGLGDDKLHGNFGDDELFGGPGDDRLFGYGDNDLLFGQEGNDLAVGNFGDDTIDGGDGDDTLWGADGNDALNGGAGNDALNGNSLDDDLVGGPGNDVLDGGIGTDRCWGDSGTDSATRCEQTDGVP